MDATQGKERYGNTKGAHRPSALEEAKAIIEAAIGGDATLTPDQRDQIAKAVNPEPKKKPRLGTTKEAARILGASTVTLRKYAK
jgi:hypothetical protein